MNTITTPPVIETNATEIPSEPVEPTTPFLKKVWRLHTKVTTPVAHLATGVAAKTTETIDEHRAYSLAKRSLKAEMTADGRALLVAQRQARAAQKAAQKAAEEAAAKLIEDAKAAAEQMKEAVS